jgi:cytochrome c biogenesis protein CcmG, thiol:disulfide interchange protein DsbE
LPSTPSSAERHRSERRWLLLIAGVVVVGLVAGVTVWALPDDTRPAPRHGTSGSTHPVIDPGPVDVGAPAPRFELPALDGRGTVSLAALRGQPVIVNFWASWCNPCRAEFPLLEKTLRAHRHEGLAVVGVTYQDIPSDSRAFVRKTHASWPQVVDRNGAVAQAYGVRALPQSFFIRPDGTLAAHVFGITSRDALRKPLEELLTPPK